MAVKKDSVQVTVLIDGKQGINELGKMEMEASELRQELKGLKKGTDEYVKANNKLTQVKEKIGKLRDELGLAGMTMQQLRRYQKDLRREIEISTTRGTAAYNKLNAKLTQVNQTIARQRAEMSGARKAWSNMTRSLMTTVAAYAGITQLISGIRNLISSSGDLSDAQAQVSKTTGLSRKEVEELTESLENLNTRTARSELLQMAKIAGKLGITAKKDVEGFVNAADKINVALGEDLGDPTESLRQLGKLIETFKVREKFGVEEGLLKVGSAINHLGKSSTANEGYIVNFTKRLGGIAPTADVSIQNILGLGAASDALGLTTEVTTTALSKLFINLTSKRKEFVRFAQDAEGNTLSLQEFTDLINNDFNEAFLSVLRGVKDNSDGMVQLTKTLGELGEDGARVVQVLSTLSQNTDVIAAQQKIANEEFEKGTSVLNEFNIMNESLGGKLDKIGKALLDTFVNSKVIKAIESMVDGIVDFINVPVSEKLEDERFELNALVLAIQSNNDNQKVRNDLIQRLQDKYPDFLKNLDAEKVSNEQLSKRLEEVNKQYQLKIVLQSTEEELIEISKEQVQLVNERLDLEEKLAKLRLSEKPDSRVSARVGASRGQKEFDIQNEIKNIESDLEELQARIPEIEARKQKLIDELGLSLSSLSVEDNDSVVSVVTSDGPSEAELSKLQEYLNKLKGLRDDMDVHLLEKDLQEIARIERKYEDLANEAAVFYQNDIINYQEYQEILRGIDNQMNDELNILFQDRQSTYTKNRDEIENQIALETASARDAEIMEEQQKWDKLIEQAEKYHLNTEDLERAKQEKLRAMREGHLQEDLDSKRDALQKEADMINEFGNFFSEISNLFGEHTAANTAFQISSGFAEVIAHQGVALAGATKAAAGASFSPIDFTIKLVAMITAVTAQIASAKNLLDKASSARSSPPSLSNNTKVPSFYYGGFSGSGNLGYGDENGPFAGFVHQNELTLSQRQLRKPSLVLPSNSINRAPAVVDLNAISNTASAGLQFGSPTSSNSQSGYSIDASEMDMVVDKLGAYIDVLIENGLSVNIGDSEIRKFYTEGKKDYDKKETNRSRAGGRKIIGYTTNQFGIQSPVYDKKR